MKEWKSYRLGDLINVLDYKRIPLSSKQREARKGIYPYYGAQGIIDYVDDFIFDGEYLLIAEDGENLKSQKQDIAQIAKGKYWVNNHAHIVESNGLCDIRYICYLINGMDLSGYITGSAQPKLNQANLLAIEVKLPSLHKQRQISDFLSRFDEKIALNTLINHNLEEQAQALYKSWFVDFEPFKDGKFVDSELGLIPAGWCVKSLGEVTKEIRDKVSARQDVKVLSPVTSGRLVLSEEFFTKQVFSESIAKYLLVKPGDFAYNPARVNIGSLGLNEYPFDGCVSPVYVVFRCESGYNHFFDLYRTTAPFKDEVLSRSSGGVRQTLAYKDFALIRIVYPPRVVIESFNSLYEGLIAVQKSNLKENEILSSQRDSLLPLLMSGRVLCVDLNC